MDCKILKFRRLSVWINFGLTGWDHESLVLRRRCSFLVADTGAFDAERWEQRVVGVDAFRVDRQKVKKYSDKSL